MSDCIEKCLRRGVLKAFGTSPASAGLGFIGGFCIGYRILGGLVSFVCLPFIESGLVAELCGIRTELSRLGFSVGGAFGCIFGEFVPASRATESPVSGAMGFLPLRLIPIGKVGPAWIVVAQGIPGGSEVIGVEAAARVMTVLSSKVRNMIDLLLLPPRLQGSEALSQDELQTQPERFTGIRNIFDVEVHGQIETIGKTARRPEF